MKKIVLAVICISFLSGCFIFKKKEKYGCPGSPGKDGKTTEMRILDGEKVKQSKFKGGN